ncbi:MAG: sialate O-acetylesterase [Chthonomonadales bacterium]|nr:sialate O-acetylesterase [Chthonomonadales bacterium]
MIRVLHGLADHQVLQRGQNGAAEAALNGTCGSERAGTVEARVCAAGYPIAGHDWRAIGFAADGRWHGRLDGLPTGGPYRVDLRLAEDPEHTTAVRDLLVGDVWVLAGQSNMEGVGDLVDVEPPSPFVHSLDMTDTWMLAEEPLHWLCDSPDAAHAEQSAPAQAEARRVARERRTKGAGLGLAFAVEMHRLTGSPIGLLPCAHGGTSMAQWDPELRGEGGASLYGSLVRRVRLAGGRVRGVLWYQGESDADPLAAVRYRERMVEFVAGLRADLDDGQLPLAMAQIGRFAWPPDGSYPSPWNTIQEVQRTLADQVAGTVMVPTVDLELDDGIHVGTQGLRRLGRRVARAACGALLGAPGGALPLRLDGAERDGASVRVRFAGVNGALRRDARPAGFSLCDPSGHDLALIYKVTLPAGSPGTLVLHLNEPAPPGTHLWYGRGSDPYCNVTDDADMAAPVFGPIVLP